MSHPSRAQYLESKVLTASQPQLHMMLLDGALRFGNQAKETWAKEADFSAAEPMLTRMFDIVEELLQGLASGEESLSKQLEEQYAFVYRELAACHINQDLKQLGSCLELLRFQRETWKLASEQTEAEQTEAEQAAPTPIAVPHMRPISSGGSSTPVSAGFSLEA